MDGSTYNRMTRSIPAVANRLESGEKARVLAYAFQDAACSSAAF